MEDDWDDFPNWRWSVQKPPKEWKEFVLKELGASRALFGAIPAEDDEEA